GIVGGVAVGPTRIHPGGIKRVRGKLGHEDGIGSLCCDNRRLWRVEIARRPAEEFDRRPPAIENLLHAIFVGIADFNAVEIVERLFVAVAYRGEDKVEALGAFVLVGPTVEHRECGRVIWVAAELADGEAEVAFLKRASLHVLREIDGSSETWYFRRWRVG